MALMRDMVRDGEVDALVPERVWQEMAKALGEAPRHRAPVALLRGVAGLWGAGAPAARTRPAVGCAAARRNGIPRWTPACT